MDGQDRQDEVKGKRSPILGILLIHVNKPIAGEGVYRGARDDTSTSEILRF